MLILYCINCSCACIGARSDLHESGEPVHVPVGRVRVRHRVIRADDRPAAILAPARALARSAALHDRQRHTHAPNLLYYTQMYCTFHCTVQYMYSILDC